MQVLHGLLLGTAFVAQSSPAQPEVTALFCQIVKDFQGMMKIILMSLTILVLNTSEPGYFRQDEFEQTGLLQQQKPC